MAPHNPPTTHHRLILPTSLRPSPTRGTIPLVVKWAGHSLNSYNGKDPMDGEECHMYTLFARPSSPLHKGAHVSLLAVSNLSKMGAPHQDPLLDPLIYDPHIRGTVVQVTQGAGRRFGCVSLIIVNECARSRVRSISLAVPNTPDVVSPTRIRKTPPVLVELFAAASLADPMRPEGIQMLERGCGGRECIPTPFDGLDAKPMSLLEMIMEDIDWEEGHDEQTVMGTVEELPEQEGVDPGVGKEGGDGYVYMLDGWGH